MEKDTKYLEVSISISPKNNLTTLKRIADCTLKISTKKVYQVMTFMMSYMNDKCDYIPCRENFDISYVTNDKCYITRRFIDILIDFIIIYATSSFNFLNSTDYEFVFKGHLTQK